MQFPYSYGQRMHITGQGKNSPNYFATPPDTKQNQKHRAFWFAQAEVTARNTINSFFQSTLHAQIITSVIQYKKVINKTFEVNSSFLEKYI